MEEEARKQWNLDFQQCWSHIVAVKCLLCPPGDADWSLGPGWTSEWTNERATDRTIGGETRSDQETTPPDVGTDQNLWPEHTLTPPLRGPEAQGAAAESGAGVRGQGAERWIFFFFFFFSPRLRRQNAREQTARTDRERYRKWGGFKVTLPKEENSLLTFTSGMKLQAINEVYVCFLDTW